MSSIPSGGDKVLAALPHLGYVPVGIAVILAVIYPSAAWEALIFSLAWTAWSMWAFTRQPRSEFLHDHLRQARRYHRLGMVSAVSTFVFFVYLAIFTWGLGAILAAVIAPALLIAWMLPTWYAAWDALHGRRHEYTMVADSRPRLEAGASA